MGNCDKVNIQELNEWAVKVSSNKKDLDKRMFDDLIKTTVSRLEKDGFLSTYKFLDEHDRKGKNCRMVGVILLRNNSIMIRDKIWSLNRKEEKRVEKNGSMPVL